MGERRSKGRNPLIDFRDTSTRGGLALFDTFSVG